MTVAAGQRVWAGSWKWKAISVSEFIAKIHWRIAEYRVKFKSSKGQQHLKFAMFKSIVYNPIKERLKIVILSEWTI